MVSHIGSLSQLEISSNKNSYFLLLYLVLRPREVSDISYFSCAVYEYSAPVERLQDKPQHVTIYVIFLLSNRSLVSLKYLCIEFNIPILSICKSLRFPRVFSPEMLYTLLMSPVRAAYSAYLLDFIILIICCEQKKL